MREDVGDVGITRSPGLDTGHVALPAGIDLEDRAARMNDFGKRWSNCSIGTCLSSRCA